VAIEGGRSGAMVMNVDEDQEPRRASTRATSSSTGTASRSGMCNRSHALGPNSIGQTVRIGLRRAGETKQVLLTIAERPAA
jgi:hypothetical protein